MERLCKHGIGHDDPDDLEYRKSVGMEASGIHGCDGCCGADFPPVTSYRVRLTDILPPDIKWKHVPKGHVIEPHTPFLYLGETTTVWYHEGIKFATTVGVDDIYFVKD